MRQSSTTGRATVIGFLRAVDYVHRAVLEERLREG
jgi:hypothetical protein